MKDTPEIRVKGFTDDWVRRRLWEVAEFYSGLTYSPENVIDSGGTFVLRSSNVQGGEIVDADNVYVDSDIVNCSNVKIDDVVVVVRNGSRNLIGKCAQVKTKMDNTVIGAFMTGLRSTQAQFVKSLLDTQQFDIEITKNLGATINQITTGTFKQMLFYMPVTKYEQTAIGNFFRILDDTITLHKRKIDGLKELKSGYLQQMFPQTGESVPRIRFAGFSELWEQRRLGEMLTERNEQMEESEEYPLMSFVGNIGVVPKGEQYDRSFLVKDDNKKYKKTKLNDFIYSSNNLETGSIGFNKTGNAVISPVYSIFYSINDSESQFIGLLSARKDFINKMIHFRQGVMYGQWRIHEKDFLKITVITPSLSEQNKIIRFFRTLDEQIAAQQTKLDKLAQLKSAYLQKMFI